MGERVCSVPGCGRVRRARGFCGGHYQRWARGDDTSTPLRTTYTAPDPCAVEGCGRAVRSSGLCAPHYLRQWQGKPLGAPFRQTAGRNERSIRDEHGRKQCSECRLWLDVSNFTKQPRSGDGLRARCRDCNRALRMKNLYGMTMEEFEARFEEQGRCCAICRGQAPRGRWCVDHNHETGSVRGILCDPCNVGLGRFRDDPDVVAAAAIYLRG